MNKICLEGYQEIITLVMSREENGGNEMGMEIFTVYLLVCFEF